MVQDQRQPQLNHDQKPYQVLQGVDGQPAPSRKSSQTRDDRNDFRCGSTESWYKVQTAY